MIVYKIKRADISNNELLYKYKKKIMAKKTFAIGEYCKGGVISVEIKKDEITIIGREFDSDKPNNSQQNSEEWIRKTFSDKSSDSKREIDLFLNDLTSSYYAEKIMDFIKENSKISQGHFW